MLCAVILVLAAAAGSCGSGGITDGARDDVRMAELWIDPPDLKTRDLFFGPGGPRQAPRPDANYKANKVDTSGFSITYEVRDDQNAEWSVKIGPEAQTEVVSSRIVWAVGYHEPPAYYVKRWTYAGAPTAPVHGRFRPKTNDLHQRGTWDWMKNPFAGTQPLRGLKVLMMILNSSDLKADNNAVYELSAARNGIRRWFVVKDLGASLGETGVIDPRRGWIDGFEQQRFITGVDRGTVKFEFHGRHHELLDDITPADVHWMCERLDRLSEQQWQDAFRAGGYDAPLALRFIARSHAKIAEGKARP